MEKKKESKSGLIISTILIIIIIGAVLYYIKPWQSEVMEVPVVAEVAVVETIVTDDEVTGTMPTE